MINRVRQQQQQNEVVVVTGRGGTVVPRRRFDGGGEEPTTTAAAGCRCRSCAAVMVADCVALGCCPCAVVSLLGLALVKAPLAVGRRCVGRLKGRRRTLLRKKRVRDVAATSASDDDGVREKGAKADVHGHGVVRVAETRDAGGEAVGGADHEEEVVDLAWLEEMYRRGHWGFGRVSFSAKTP